MITIAVASVLILALLYIIGLMIKTIALLNRATKRVNQIIDEVAPRLESPNHEHESWQIRSDGQGGRYCAACGFPQSVKLPALQLGTCPHNDPLCTKYGCPDDPKWRGDRR